LQPQNCTDVAGSGWRGVPRSEVKKEEEPEGRRRVT
jgi:hypothetical protein